MADTATQKAQDLPSKKSEVDSTTTSPKSVKKTASEAPEKAKNAKDTASEAPEQVEDAPSQIDAEESQAPEEANGTINGTQNGTHLEEEQSEAPTNADDEGTEAIQAGSVGKNGDVLDNDGNVIGHVNGDDVSRLEGSLVDQEGDVLDEEGNILAHAESVGDSLKEVEPKPVDDTKSELESEQPDVDGSQKPLEDIDKPEIAGPFGVQDNGEITNATGQVIGNLAEGEPQDLVGTSIKEIDEEGNLKAKSGSVVGKAELNPELLEKAEGSQADGSQLPEGADVPEGEEVPKTDELPEGEEAPKAEDLPEGENVPGEEDVPEAEAPDLSLLKGKTVNKAGKIVDEEGNPFGILVEGEAKKLIGKKVDGEGKIWDDGGKVIGRAELLPEDERAAEPSAPFEDFPDSIVDAKGNVIFEGKVVGKLVEGDAKKLEGKKVDADGDVLDKNGNTLGKAERFQEEDEVPEAEEPTDLSVLEGKKVNKAGNVVDENGKLFGRVIEGDVAKLVGKKTDGEGKIWSESGKVIGQAELIPVDDRDESSGAPFEDFPDAVVDSKGLVTYEGQVVGKLIEGDAKKLAGKKVDKDGEVVDKIGNVLGKAERYEEPEPEPEAEPEKVDLSALAGKRVNKIGNVVDSNGQIYGRLVEGDPKKLAGKMVDKDGNVWNDGGNVVGKAELVPESERDGEKEGPFAGFDAPTVTKDGKVADSKGAIIGRLIEGDAKKLYGKSVDADGDVLDGNGNTLGKAERWEEEVKEKKKSPVEGRKVNKDGNVVDDDGNIIAKLTEGEISKCAGKEIDPDGDIVNDKGTTVGHVTLIGDIPDEPEPEPEPEETPEEIEARKQREQDIKLAKHLGNVIQGSLDKIKPILTMISDSIDEVEKKPEEERDEQKLVDTVRPLIEEGGRILSETNGAIRGLDPDGRIQANAKHASASEEASPEEHRLADLLKELTENVTTTIDKAKKKIAGMPHAKKELNPLWGLLAEPLGQILAAVGLLLSGVLGLVGKLLSGLGLGGLLDNLLGGLGIKGILKGLGLGTITSSLTGKK